MNEPQGDRLTAGRRDPSEANDVPLVVHRSQARREQASIVSAIGGVRDFLDGKDSSATESRYSVRQVQEPWMWPCLLHWTRGLSREFSRDREAIADREHAQLDARIVPDPGVEGAKCHGILGTVILVCHTDRQKA